MKSKYHFKVLMFVVFLISLFYYLFSRSEKQKISAIGNVRQPENKSTKELFGKPYIFFLETSGRLSLDNRQLASVESAAHYLHQEEVIVYMFTKKPIRHSSLMLALKTIYGVRFEQAEMSSFFSETPLESWYKSDVWRKSTFKIEHTSDALRAAVLWKHGGVYLDLDMIMIKETSFTKASVLWTYGKVELTNAFMMFYKNHPLIKLYMEEFAKKYQHNTYLNNGPTLLTKTYGMYLRLLKESGKASDIVELNPEVLGFYVLVVTPLHFVDFARDYMLAKETNETIGLHMFNKGTKFLTVKADSNCSYMHHVRKSSPIVYTRIQKVGTL